MGAPSPVFAPAHPMTITPKIARQPENCRILLEQNVSRPVVSNRFHHAPLALAAASLDALDVSLGEPSALLAQFHHRPHHLIAAPNCLGVYPEPLFAVSSLRGRSKVQGETIVSTGIHRINDPGPEKSEGNGGPKPGGRQDKNSVEAVLASQVCRLVHTFMRRIMA